MHQLPIASLLLVAISIALVGCRTAAPIHVWRPPLVESNPHAVIAVAPLATDPVLARTLETAVLDQRPAARADFAIVTSQQLLEASPVRLASTAALYSDLSAIQSAQAVGADIVLCGQIYNCNIDLGNDPASDPMGPQNPNLAGLQAVSSQHNRTFLQRLFGKEDDDPGYFIVLSWNVIEVQTGKSLGSREFRITSREAIEKYPDLRLASQNPAQRLLTAAARETWNSIAPAVEKEEVRLAAPLLQPGAIRTQLGVRAAKQGHWQMAEYHWQRAAWWPGFLAPAAHHNLAVAHAAREDFAAAKQELMKVGGPLSLRVPGETLVWLDQQHRLYNESHRLAPPLSGWAFPDIEQQPERITRETHGVETIGEFDRSW